MPSVLWGFSVSFIFWGRGSVPIFYETTSLLCFLFGTAEWKTKLILVKKKRLCSWHILAGDTKQEGTAKSRELD